MDFNGATKLYFMYNSRLVSILFIESLYKSTFSTHSFGKLSFCPLRVYIFSLGF